MRYVRFAIAMCLATGCGAWVRTDYQSSYRSTGYIMRYAITPRAMLWNALQAARGLHYSVVAIESPDVHHNVFLAFGDRSATTAPTALLVEISTAEDEDFDEETAHATTDATVVAVEPMAFRHGQPVPWAQVSAETRDAAELLALAIDQQNRGDRLF